MTRPIYTAPILMSAPMVLALLRGARGEAGGKTQTRRFPTKAWDALERRAQAGDDCRLWVRESWRGVVRINAPWEMTKYGVARYTPDQGKCKRVEYGATQQRDSDPWRPSIHMPRWASRLTLLDVTIRRERLGDISEADALAEGCRSTLKRFPDGGYIGNPATWHYAALWDQLHGPDSWDRNQDREVMVIGFRPVLGNIDAQGAGEAA